MPGDSRWLLHCAALAVAAASGCRSLHEFFPSPGWLYRLDRVSQVSWNDDAPIKATAAQFADTLNTRAGHHHAVEDEPSGPPSRPTAMVPLLLEDVIRLALATNPDLHSVNARASIAESSLARARAELYPKLNLSQQYAVTNNPALAFSYELSQARFSFGQNINHPGTLDNFQSRARLEHRLYSGHERSAHEDAAEAMHAAAILDLAATRNQLVFDIAEAYYRLLQTRDLVWIANDTVAQVEEHVRITHARYNAETAMRSDVLAMEVRLAEVTEAQIAAENRFQLAWAVLRNVTGANIPPQPLPLEIPPSPWIARTRDLQQSLNCAVNQRPEVMAAQRRAAAAESDLAAAQAGSRPKLDGVADYDVFSGDLNSANDTYFLGLVLQWSLFDAGRTSSEVQRVSARLCELNAQHRRLLLDIELEVEQSFVQLRDAQERLRVAEHAIDCARQRLQEVDCRYRNEMATVTELVDAQVGLSSARARRATALADIQIASAAIERAVGDLCLATQN